MRTANKHKNAVTQAAQFIFSCRSTQDFSGSHRDAKFACVAGSTGQKISPLRTAEMPNDHINDDDVKFGSYR